MGTRFRSSLSIGLVAPLAYGQGNMGGGGSSLAPSDVTDSQIESAARIVMAIQQLQQKYRQQYGNPQNLDSSKVAEVRRKLMKELQQVMSKKVKEEGMSMQTFQQIMQTARQDSTLRTEMRSAIMEMRNVASKREQAHAQSKQSEGQTESSSSRRRAAPPNLNLENMKFADADGNEVLEAGETATLTVVVRNSGEGTAREVILRGETSAAVEMPSTKVEKIQPGQSQRVSLNVRGGQGLSDGSATITIRAEEGAGFDADPTEITFPTAPYRPPSLHIQDVAIDDQGGNGNGQIEPGEVVQVTARIVNRGEGTAEGVRGAIRAGENVFVNERKGGQMKQSLGRLEPGGYADVTFEAFCNSRAEAFPVTLSIQTESGEGTVSPQDLGLALNRTFKKPESLVVKGDPPEVNSETEVPSLTVDIWENVPKTSMDRPNDVAVVIGIRQYPDSDISDVDYALRDATIMRRYLTEVLGFREENVIFVENASGAELTRIFGTASDPQGQLYNYLKPGESDVFVYYSGHGAPDLNSEKAYLVASDTDPDYLTLNGYPVDQLYSNLAQLPAQAVTVVLEACFSGVTEAGSIVENVSPAGLSVENPVLTMENGLAITAGAANQVSSWYPEKKHGLFTYFFLKGLSGAADRNSDGAVTASEMGQYLTDTVTYRARRMYNREQTPQVTGRSTTNRVLVRFDQ